MTKLDFAVTDEWGVNYFSSVPEAVDLYERSFREVQLEEQLGFQSHFIVEHQGVGVGQVQSPTVYLSALAQRTKTIRLGVLVFPLPFYNPMRLAQDAAMVDQLSRGRLEFGVGIGTRPHEFLRWYLPDFSERRAMATESLEIIEKAWAEGSVTYEGKYWQFDEAIPLPRPYQKPHPPIWWGGVSKASVEFAVAHNYNFALALRPDSEMAESLAYWRRLRKDGGSKGPIPRSLVSRSVYVAETDEQALEEAALYLPQAYTYGEDRLAPSRLGNIRLDDTPQGQKSRDYFHGLTTGVDFWLKSGQAHVGSPETVIESLRKSQELIGFDVFMGSFRWGPIPDQLVEKSMRLFADKVMPAFS